jgi:hypothetical protein
MHPKSVILTRREAEAILWRLALPTERLEDGDARALYVVRSGRLCWVRLEDLTVEEIQVRLPSVAVLKVEGEDNV